MKRNHWIHLIPSLVVAAGIMGSVLVAVLAAKSGWLVLTGPLLLAFSVVGADALRSRLRGQPSRPSAAALLLGGSFVLAGVILTPGDPGLVASFIPIIGAGAWGSLFLSRSDSSHKVCRGI